MLLEADAKSTKQQTNIVRARCKSINGNLLYATKASPTDRQWR